MGIGVTVKANGGDVKSRDRISSPPIKTSDGGSSD
jgi:hypothetical protein